MNPSEQTNQPPSPAGEPPAYQPTPNIVPPSFDSPQTPMPEAAHSPNPAAAYPSSPNAYDEPVTPYSAPPNAYQPTPQLPLNNLPQQPLEPAPDVNGPTAADEEMIAPSIPQGNHEILVIKRHPFGLVALYLQAIVGIGLALGVIFFLVSSILTGDTRSKVLPYLLIISLVVAALVGMYLVIATYIYRQSRWIVTDDSIQQKLQRGLFSHQSSELSMANIEDVTADQKGILAELFGFGTLKAETAGELPYFHFLYCPTPDKYAKIILAARERFINEDPAQAKRANDLLNVPGGFRR